LFLVGCAVFFLDGCAVVPKIVLEHADARARDNDFPRALKLYDEVAARKDSTAKEKLQALLDGADVCDRMKDDAGAQQRLERGILLEWPGLTERAMFYLAEHIRGADRPRAMNLYYRAASRAEQNGRGFPYKTAMDRIIQLSASSP
jgi:hypothetical protein